ncbi:RhuM family protein [Granulicatella elegans]|uniref:RhuM family protein n=1 Tax=Granulicatella elegans TaxID=137732 RepID=UPI003C75653B
MNHFILYHTEDGNSKINLTLENGTIWLTQLQIAELFQTTKQTISKLIKNILEDGELDEKVVVNYRFTATNQGEIEGELPKRKVASYNLDMILAIDYRMQSPRGIQFRKYASTVLKEYFIKGFAMDDERFKNLGGDRYFEELLERIRDIRLSGKVFYRQLLDLFSISVDYNKNSGEAKRFFATFRNKLHFPIHHQTTTETGDNQGVKLVNGELPTFSESKRHLTEKKLSSFNQLVSECLDFAETQAKRECEMTMKDWNNHVEQLLSKIDDDIESDKKLFSESIDTNIEEEKINDVEYTINQVENDCLRKLKKIESIIKNIE